MEIKNAKCSSSKHAEINAASYCPECKKYLCNKCVKFHAEMEDHKTYNLNENNEIFIDIKKFSTVLFLDSSSLSL